MTGWPNGNRRGSLNMFVLISLCLLSPWRFSCTTSIVADLTLLKLEVESYLNKLLMAMLIQSRISRVAEIDEIQVPHELLVAPLCIKDPPDYYDSQQVNATKQEAGMKQTASLMQRMICSGTTTITGIAFLQS